MTGTDTRAPGAAPGAVLRSDRLPEALLAVAATAALTLSATGIWAYAGHTLALTGLWRLLPVLGLEAAVGVCAVLARRSKLASGTRGAYGAAMWVLAAVSALLASIEADTTAGQVGRAAFPFVAAALWELLTSYRHGEASPGPDRRVGVVRWAHPVERVRVMLELATDADMPESTATHRVRVRVAAWRLHRLSQLPARGLRFRVANRRAGAALSRAGSREPIIHRAVVADVYEIASARRVATDTVAAAAAAETVQPAQVFTRDSDPDEPDRADGIDLIDPVDPGPGARSIEAGRPDPDSIDRVAIGSGQGGGRGSIGSRSASISPAHAADRGRSSDTASSAGSGRDRPGRNRPRSGRTIEDLRAELSAAIEVGSIDRDNPAAEPIRRELQCSPQRARELRDELIRLGGNPPLGGQ